MTAPIPPLPAACPLYQSRGLRALETAARGQPLMERAGLAAADLAAGLCRHGPILILAGPGNNGGDAYVAARHLQARFFDVHLVAYGDPRRAPADAQAARQAFVDAGGRLLAHIPDRHRWGLVMDGLFGIGLQRPLEGDYAAAVDAANRLAARQACPLLALDCPSGLDADTGRAFGPAIRASHTLTFIAHKPGLLTLDGPDHAGILHFAPLELDAGALVRPDGWSVGREQITVHLLPRQRNSHKGSYGAVGILGGAPSMVGAALLAGRAALFLGSGRVFVGLADRHGPAFDPLQAELMLRPAADLFAAPL
ncbi:MAG TPA: NAD(P)H-hydrate epimerase, partial [Azospira sp.]|nr:NAD(P)H-hydrate epimerase [Azospira sp.]